jgi:hypothetical protein
MAESAWEKAEFLIFSGKKEGWAQGVMMVLQYSQQEKLNPAPL